MMNYEKKYNEALKRAKAAIDVAADKDLVKGVASTIFPELRESEDERIKNCIRCLTSLDQAQDVIEDMGFTRQDLLVWLKKQKDRNNPLEDYSRGYNDGYYHGATDNAKKEPKQEWSEEDEKRLNAVIELLENTSAIHPNYSHRKLIIWLQDLRPQKKEVGK